ncbi:tetratricopeptide repeat-containing sulfotransferase family protein [Rubrimonas cliftonensis]|uniref:Sulfotransferase family protein n=1 Tax=Rubrimonas cliftonensis TaxID=89524 RepID=A0A1H4CW95_9RHOB|nr:sulfotransferase [Rubrimonas cliftonensis]SEA64600.1 Sulfotransferase family protein [Rubrimonas cliftonensis]
MTGAAAETADFPELAAARALWSADRRDAALAAFAAAAGARPRNVKALLEAARAHGACFEIARAERLLEQAQAVGGGDPRVATAIAASYGRIFRERRAIALLEAMAPRPPAARAELAALYERIGRLDAALDEIEACRAAAPDAPELLLALGRVLRRKGDARPAAAALRRALALSSAPPLAAEAWSELSYLHDAAGEFDAAAAAIDRAHAVIRAGPDIARLLAQAAANNRAVERLSQAFGRERLAAWRARSPERRSEAVGHLIGFPRSGTTLLEQRLDAHPGVVASPERPLYLRDLLPALCRAGGGPLSLASLDAAPEAAVAALRARYLSGMAAALGEDLGGRLHIDKNPNHTGLLPGLLRLFPESRVVTALRDPRDVVTSCVMRTFRVTEFSAMLLDWGSAAALYAVEMGAWLRYRAALDPAQLVETRYEDGLDDFAGETRRTLAALGLPWDDAVLGYRERLADKAVNSPTQTEVRRPPHRGAVGRWRNHEARLAPHMDVLRPFVEAFGYD